MDSTIIFCLVSLVVILATSTWVLFEERRLRHRVNDSRDTAAKTYPIQWFALCVTVWPLFFPLYLLEHHRDILDRLAHRGWAHA